jgi:hypothetical protein
MIYYQAMGGEMQAVQTDEDIQRLISECCEKAEKKELAGKIEIGFVKPEVTKDKLTEARIKPGLKILINKSAWMDTKNHDRVFALKNEVSYLLACYHFDRKVRRNGSEYRYFAFKIGAVEIDTEPEKIESFVFLSEW